MRFINKYNFLRWFSAEDAITTITDPAKGYERDAERCDYAPMLINGEPLIFYINTLVGLNDIIADPGTAKLKLVNAQTGQVVDADISTLQQDTFVTEDGDNVFTFYASVSPSLIPPGVYFFRIGDDVDNFLDSNNVVVPSDTNYSNHSCLVRFRHDRYYYGVNYQNLSDFYQQFRLQLNQVDRQYENDKDVYNEVTTGKQRTYNNYKKKLRTIEAYYFDDSAHDAAAVMFDSEELFINGRQYVPKGTYKPQTNVQSKLNKGSVDLYDQDFATANRCLTPITSSDDCVAVVLPEIDPPDGVEGEEYSYSVTLTGDQPFQLSDAVAPAGLHWGIFGNILSLTGTPTSSGSAQAASVTVSNCSDNSEESFSDTIDIAEAANGTHWLDKVDISSDSTHDYETIQIQGEADEDIVVTVSNYANNNGGTLTFDGTLITGIGQTFSITLNGAGQSTVFDVHIDGSGTPPPGASAILGEFTITSASGGSIGTPADYQIDKVFL